MIKMDHLIICIIQMEKSIIDMDAYMSSNEPVIDTIKFCLKTNSNIRYRVYKTKYIFIVTNTAVILVEDVDDARWNIHMSNNHGVKLIRGYQDLDNHFCEHILSTEILRYVAAYYDYSLFKRICYFLLINDNYENLLRDNFPFHSCSDEFIQSIMQLYAKDISHKLSRNLVLFDLRSNSHYYPYNALFFEDDVIEILQKTYDEESDYTNFIDRYLYYSFEKISAMIKNKEVPLSDIRFFKNNYQLRLIT